MDNFIIVFGATGNLGAYITKDLLDNGYQVIAVGHRESDNGFWEQRGVPYYSVDICNKKDFLRLPTKNVYAVVHFAGVLPARTEYNPTAMLESFVMGTLNILDYMVAVGCKKIIFPQTPADLYYLHNSSLPIPADAQRSFPKTGVHSVYTIAKNAAIDLIEFYHSTYGISRFILRFFTIYQYYPNPYHIQNGTRKMMPYRILIDKAIKGESIEVWGDPNRSKEITYIKDFTQAVRKCIEVQIEGGIYNIGCGKPVTLEEQIQGIIDVFSPKEHPSKKVYCPDKPNARLNHLDILKSQRELGYEPRYTYVEAMKDFLKEMREEPFAELWGKRTDFE